MHSNRSIDPGEPSSLPLSTVLNDSQQTGSGVDGSCQLPMFELTFDDDLAFESAVDVFHDALEEQPEDVCEIHDDDTEDEPFGGIIVASKPFVKDTETTNVEDRIFIPHEPVSSELIAIPLQPRGAGTMGRHKKLTAINRPQYSPLQSALKSPVHVKTPGTAKKVSFSFNGEAEETPNNDDNSSPSHNGHEAYKLPLPSPDQCFFTPKRTFQRHRRASSWSNSLASSLGLGPALTYADSDGSGLFGKPNSAPLPLTPSQGLQKNTDPDLLCGRLPDMSCSLPSTPKHGSHDDNDQSRTSGSRVSTPAPQTSLLSQSASRVYTTNRNDPFAEREYISSPTAEVVTSAYASDRPRDFQQYLGCQPLVDPFRDMDLSPVQTGGPTSLSSKSTPPQAQMNLQNFEVNGKLAGPVSPQLQVLEDLPYKLTGIGSQFAGGSQSIGAPQSPLITNIPGSISDASSFARNTTILRPPLHHIQQTIPDRARLDARKTVRKSWIEDEAHKIFLACKKVQDRRIQFSNSGSPEDYRSWKVAEEDLKKLTSMDYQIQNRRKMFMPRGMEPLRLGEANVPGDGFHGDGHVGGLMGFQMALMEKIGVEAISREKMGLGIGESEWTKEKKERVGEFQRH